MPYYDPVTSNVAGLSTPAGLTFALRIRVVSDGRVVGGERSHEITSAFSMWNHSVFRTRWPLPWSRGWLWCSLSQRSRSKW